MQASAFSPSKGSASKVNGLTPLVVATSAARSPGKKLDSLIRAATVDAGSFHALLVLFEAEDGSNLSQYNEYLVKKNLPAFHGLVDLGFDLKLNINGVEMANSKGYARRVFLALFQEKPTKKLIKQQLESWANLCNDLSANNPHTRVADNFILPFKHLCDCLTTETVKKVAEFLFQSPVEDPTFWEKHGPQMAAFWPFGTWNHDAMAYYGAGEEVLDLLLLDNSDNDEDTPAGENIAGGSDMEDDGEDEEDGKDGIADGDEFIVADSDVDDDDDFEED